MLFPRVLLASFAWFVFAEVTFAQAPLVGILQQELDRNYAALQQKGDPKPYFLQYAVTDTESDGVSATQGALQSLGHNRIRAIDVSIRVGDRKFDNYHSASNLRGMPATATTIALDDSPAAIRRKAWIETDQAYRIASQRLIQLKTNQQVKAAPSDDSDDFSTEAPSTFSKLPVKYSFSAADWTARLRKLSAEFNKHPRILNSNITVIVQREVKTLVNTEGSKLEHGRLFARVMITARGRTGDGMDMSSAESFETDDTAKLPKDAQILAAIEKVAKDLDGLLSAPPVDPFVGPAILSGRAAGVFFHEIFGHRIEGHRQKDENDGQTFTKKVNEPILPAFLSVTFDPTVKEAAGQDLNGTYAFDDEGVKARRLPIVENGVLKSFLMSRSPIKGFPNSNGHGRGQPGGGIVSRQSNLFVESKNAVSDAELRKMLKAEIKKQGKPYGLYFEQVTGGFTTTGRASLQAFTVVPLVVYRVFPDERPDELVRGADIVGTPLASFAKILATSAKVDVFNGYCGAESGSVPVSAVSPAMLVSEIEVQRKKVSQDAAPYLSRPPAVGGISQ